MSDSNDMSKNESLHYSTVIRCEYSYDGLQEIVKEAVQEVEVEVEGEVGSNVMC